MYVIFGDCFDTIVGYSYDQYSILPNGKVWYYDTGNSSWNIKDHQSLTMSVRKLFVISCVKISFQQSKNKLHSIF